MTRYFLKALVSLAPDRQPVKPKLCPLYWHLSGLMMGVLQVVQIIQPEQD